MPSRNLIKIYVKDSYYHIYNRGVEKRIIFEDDQDYKVFLKYLKEALSNPSLLRIDKIQVTLQGGSFKGVPRQPKNFDTNIDLIAYCLMPNHFHLLIKQKENNSMEHFMRSIITRYSMYFNKKYNRVGKLFQGHYKAVLILDDNYLLHLSRYIHLNPSEYNKNLESEYSSYAEYLGIRKTSWVKPEIVLAFFNQATRDFHKDINTYKKFVESTEINSISVLEKMTLEDSDL